MYILNQSVKYWKIAGIYLRVNASKSERRVSALFYSLFVAYLITFCLMSLMSLLSEERLSLNFFYACNHLVAFSLTISTLTASALAKHKMGALVRSVEVLIRKSESYRVRTFPEYNFFLQVNKYSKRNVYASAEKYSNLVATFNFYYNFLSYPSLQVAATIGSLIRDYRRGYLDIATWFNILNLRTPWDRTTLIGFALFFAYQVMFVFVAGIVVTNNLTKHAGISLYIEALCHNWCDLIDQIDVQKDKAQLCRLLRKSIEFNIEILE